MNAAWFTITGMSVQESRGRPFLVFFAEDDHPLLLQLTAPMSADRSPHTLQLRRSDGSQRWVTFSMISNRSARVVGVLRDITEEKISREMVARLSIVASVTDSLVVITDARGLVEWCNEATLGRTGYSLEEMLGRTPGSLLQGPDTDPVTVREIGDALRAQVSVQREILNYTKA